MDSLIGLFNVYIVSKRRKPYRPSMSRDGSGSGPSCCERSGRREIQGGEDGEVERKRTEDENINDTYCYSVDVRCVDLNVISLYLFHEYVRERERACWVF